MSKPVMETPRHLGALTEEQVEFLQSLPLPYPDSYDSAPVGKFLVGVFQAMEAIDEYEAYYATLAEPDPEDTHCHGELLAWRRVLDGMSQLVACGRCAEPTSFERWQERKVANASE